MTTIRDSFDLAVAIHSPAARHEVLTIAVQEVLRTLSAHQAKECSAAIRARVDALTTETLVLSVPQTDEALAQELSAVLLALNAEAR